MIRDKLFKAFDEKFLRLWESRGFCDIFEFGPDWVDSLEDLGIVFSSWGGVEPILDPYTLRANAPSSPKRLMQSQLYLHVSKDLKEKILALGFVP